jgi:hypothetical protein
MSLFDDVFRPLDDLSRAVEIYNEMVLSPKGYPPPLHPQAIGPRDEQQAAELFAAYVERAERPAPARPVRGCWCRPDIFTTPHQWIYDPESRLSCPERRMAWTVRGVGPRWIVRDPNEDPRWSTFDYAEAIAVAQYWARADG